MKCKNCETTVFNRLTGGPRKLIHAHTESAQCLGRDTVAEIYGDPGRAFLRSLYNEGWDKGDPWGSNIAFLFGISEVLYHFDGDIPGEWEYRHAANRHDSAEDCIGDQYPDRDILDEFMADQFTLEDLVSFGKVLHRYGNMLRKAGRDY